MTVEAPASPGVAGPVDATGAAAPHHDGPTLSPSRAADFKICPLLFRFRTIDRLPERPSPDAARGTLVHAVLERLFDLPAAERTPDAAGRLVEPQWARLREERPELADLFAEGLDEADFVRGASDLLGGYFAVEDPRRLEPAEREVQVETRLGEDLLLRGIVDRLDVAPGGELRVVDYKTGGAPREAFEARALFQLKFYALVLWRTRGTVPRVLRLLYLRDAEVCDYAPDADELALFERILVALWQAIEKATLERDFRPRPSRLCGWCSHQALCPAFGGTPPPWPPPREEARKQTGHETGAAEDAGGAGTRPAPSPG
jgi:putative RecB family exonuclease